MKDFFKMFFASVLGVVTAGIILACISLFIMVGWITSVASSFSKTESVSILDNSILVINFSELPETENDDPFTSFTKQEKTITLNNAIKAIKIAKNNPSIKGIYLNTEMPTAGMASLDEVRRALQDFKKSGKFIIAYGDNYTQKGYYLSSIADKVFLNPLGKVNIIGIASSTIFYKKALDKLGVEMLTFKVGTYKGAVEPYILDHLSDANKEQIKTYINGLWDNIVEDIAKARNITPESIREFADQGHALEEGEMFLKTGLIDSLVYREDLYGYFKNKLDIEKSKKLNLVSLNDVLEGGNIKVSKGEKIAVVFAEGVIMPEQADIYDMSSGITEKLTKQLKQLAEDDNIKAVVMRVNSPGGSAFLSEQIWYQVANIKKAKPIVVSMGDYAASGGYYISSAANKIFAEPNTLTGSIGIFGQVPNASKFVEKIGLNVDVVKTSKFSDMILSGNIAGIMKPMSEDEKALIQKEVERGYDIFISRVAEGRNMTKEKVDSIGQGRVWLGEKALELGLVDHLGGLDDAIAAAAKLANLSDYRLVYDVSQSSNIFELFFKTGRRELELRLMGKALSREELFLLREYRNIMQPGIMTRLPYGFNAY